MSMVKSAWPVLAEHAQKKVAELEAQFVQAKAKEQQQHQQLLRVSAMVEEYRVKQRTLEQGSRLSDSVNCRNFLSQLIGVEIQAERGYKTAANNRFDMARELKAARIEFEKMKKLVEREKKATQQLAAKQAQKSMDELATMRHGWRHA